MQLLSKYRQLEFYFLVLFKLTRTKKKALGQDGNQN